MTDMTDAAARAAGTAEAATDARSAAIIDDDAAERAALERLADTRPAPQPPQDRTDADAAPDADAASDEAQDADEEEIELSFGAKTLKVKASAIPPEVRTELETFTKSVQADYTRKTQELAEQRRETQAKIELADKLVTLKGEALKLVAYGQVLSDEIKRLEATDFDRLWNTDRDEYRRLSDLLAAKRAEHARIIQAVAQYEAAVDAEQERYIAAQLEAGREAMRRAVKGFDEAKERELIEYAVKTYGIPEDEARKWPLNPKTALMCWKAMQYDRIQQRATQASQPKPPPAPAQPVKPIRAQGDTGRSRDLAWLAEHDIEGYARERARQEAAARKR